MTQVLVSSEPGPISDASRQIVADLDRYQSPGLKGTPQFPMCYFSGQVVQILDNLGVDDKGLNVLENDELRHGIKTYCNWPTIPQLYVKGEFVGGCDIIGEMFQSGELQSLLNDKGVTTKAPASA